MLTNRAAHLGNDVFLSGDSKGAFSIFDKTSSVPTKPHTTMGLHDSSFHPSPCASYIAIMAPFPSLQHYVFLPASQHTLFLRTIAPVASCVWHPKVSHILLVLTANDTIEVFDILADAITDVVPRHNVLSLQTLKNNFSPGGSHHNHGTPNTPSSSKARGNADPNEGTMSNTAFSTTSTSQLVVSKHHMPHNLTRFVHISAVEGVTGADPLLLLLAGDPQGHVFSVQMEDDGTFPMEGDHSPVPVFYCDNKLMPKYSHKTATCALSVQGAMVDATRGLFAVSVLRSDGVVSSGYLREKWMYHGLGHHHPIQPSAFNLFHPLEMAPRPDDVVAESPTSTRRGGKGGSNSATTTPRLTSSKKQVSNSKLGGRQFSSGSQSARSTGAGNSSVAYDNALVRSPSRRENSQESPRSARSGGMSSRLHSSHFTQPDIRGSYMEVHHCSRMENLVMYGVCPTPRGGDSEFSDGESEDSDSSDSSTDGEDIDRKENKNRGGEGLSRRKQRRLEGEAQVRDFALVAFPYWDESNQGWIYDPVLATRIDQHHGSQHEDPSKSFRLPIIGTNHKCPPPPLAMKLPLDLTGYNVTLGNYTLCLEPDRCLAAPGNSDANAGKKTTGNEKNEMSPIFVSLNNFLMTGLMAVTPWSESGPELATPFHHADIAGKAHPIFGGVCEVMGNILAQGYTFQELDGQLRTLHQDINSEVREKLKAKDATLSKKQQQLQDKAIAIRAKFSSLEKQLDGHDLNLTNTAMARKGVPALVAVNERLGQLHNTIEELEYSLELSKEKRLVNEQLQASKSGVERVSSKIRKENPSADRSGWAAGGEKKRKGEVNNSEVKESPTAAKQPSSNSFML